MAILSTNTKLKKSEKIGYKTFGIHFSPYKMSGKNVCPHASKGCAAACLNTAGYGRYQRIQQFRLEKTKRFNNDRLGFVSDLIEEIRTQVRRCEKNGIVPSFRLNLTSDVSWESIKVDGKNIMEMFPNVAFYDYTKNLSRMMRYLTGKFPSNYHLTFSRSEENQDACDIVMGCGGNVAIVFNRIPKTYKKKKVINGDEHDLRFLDKKGVIVGLVAKGDAKKDTTGFVIHV